MWNPLEKEAVLQNLKDAGCNCNVIERFLCLVDEGKQKEQLCLLADQRERLLRSLHAEQKRIECLDYLVYQIERHTKKRERQCMEADEK